MQLEVTRLGQSLVVEVSEAERIAFPEGIVGFESDTEFALLPDPEGGIFWLHSLTDPQVAFATLDPFLIWADYDVSVPDADVTALGLTTPSDAHVLVVITPREDPAEITANLRAPIVINEAARVGRQVILQDSPYPIRTPVLAALARVSAEPVPAAASGARVRALEAAEEFATTDEEESKDTLGRAAA